MTPKIWIHDNRPIVWTCSHNPDHYNLYLHSILIGENLTFDQFYPLWISCHDKLKQKIAA